MELVKRAEADLRLVVRVLGSGIALLLLGLLLAAGMDSLRLQVVGLVAVTLLLLTAIGFTARASRAVRNLSGVVSSSAPSSEAVPPMGQT